jgi:hypothetical protein
MSWVTSPIVLTEVALLDLVMLWHLVRVYVPIPIWGKRTVTALCIGLGCYFLFRPGALLWA